jgi:uncharacterized protein YkwD
MRNYFLLLLLIMLGIAPAPQPAVAQNDLAAGQAIVQAINGWRLELDLWPLRENATLERMAYDQASYILSLPAIPAGGAIHAGATGAGPMERAHFPQYDWPAYGRSDNTAIGEIAYVGRGPDAARGYWETSTIHRGAALNAAYREIGVAALPHRFGYVYIIVFGSRPNVLPAIADLQTDMIYLSNERYEWARSPWIQNVRRVRLFDGEGRPLSADWTLWDSTMPLPEDAGDELFVEYIDENNVVALAEVSLDSSESALPPSTRAPATASPRPTQTVITPSATTRAVQTQAATQQATQTLRPGAPTPTQGAVVVVPATPSSSNILLLYDARSFTLINSSQIPLNVRELVFYSSGGTTFRVTSWETQWLSGSLTALAGSDCLQVWSWQETGTLAQPSRCRQRRSVLTLSPTALFWKQGDFEVRLNNQLLAVCSSTATQCEFAVP